MTIALGLLTQSCFVLAADSEESYGWSAIIKSTVSKISIGGNFEMEGSAVPKNVKIIAITGAGDSGYLSALKSHIIAAFRDNTKVRANNFGPILSTIVKSFHHDHVAPYNNPLELSVDLVIGASSDGLLRLWKSHMGAVEDVDPYDWARVGSGAVWGGLPRTHIDPTVEQKQIALAAAYAVFFAKEYGGGCGKNTQLVVVPSDGFHQLGATDVLDRLDVLFRRYSGLEAQIRNYVLGLPCPDLFGGRDAATEQYRKLIDEVAAWLFRAPKSSGPRTSGAPQ